MNGQEKFDTCKFRSQFSYKLEIRSGCCGDTTSREIDAFQCMHSSILLDNVMPNFCQICEFYKPKKVKENRALGLGDISDEEWEKKIKELEKK